MSQIVFTICIAILAVTPASDYHTETISGFTVLIHPEVLKQEADAAEMRKELAAQLEAIERVVPADRLAELKKVRIWVEWNKRPNGAAEFHVSKAWLKANGYNSEKEGCVEIGNVRNFIEWSRRDQPWMMMHELAHAFHHLVLGVDHKGIKSAYDDAMEKKLYESVKYVRGDKKKAYATTNPQEYFAELAEAYFGKNDFYPFTREELRKHDPAGYRMVEGVWGKVKGRKTD